MVAIKAEGLKVFKSHLEGFFKELTEKRFSKNRYDAHQKALQWFVEYLEAHKIYQKGEIRREKLLDSFVKWKISKRKQKKYHREYRQTVRNDLNRFLDWLFEYDRVVLQEKLKKYLALQKYRYSRKFIEVQSEVLSFFDYIEEHRLWNLRKITPYVLENHIDWKERRFYGDRNQYSDGHENISLKACLKNYYRYLWRQGVPWLSFPLKIPKEQRALHYEELIDGYLDYCKVHKGLSQSTLWHIKHELKRFDWYLQDIKVFNLSKLKIEHVDRFIAATYSHEKIHSIQRGVHVLRGFLRQMKELGEIKKDLCEYIVCPPSYRLGHVPKFLNPDEVHKIFDSIDRKTDVGIRKYAVLKLLYCNGLRIGEVAQLSLDDLNWEEKSILIRKRKNGIDMVIPMYIEVEEALKDYILKVRPNDKEERHLFFTLQAPICPLESRALIVHIARDFRKLALSGGSHRLRHTSAQNMLESGRSLYDVQEHLGHETITSTQIYTKTDIERMRKYVVHSEF